MTTIEQSCIEVCEGERLVGYAIFFSGGWDAYLFDGRESLVLIDRNVATKQRAIAYIRHDAKRRCEKCGWPLQDRIEDGCTAESCSERTR